MAKKSKLIQLTQAGQTISYEISDFSEAMDLPTAQTACAALGPEWRLPTLEEATALHDKNLAKGNLKFGNYDYHWTSDQSPDGMCMAYSFAEGKSFVDLDSGTNRVFALRELMA